MMEIVHHGMDKSTDKFASIQVLLPILCSCMTFYQTLRFIVVNNCFVSPPCTCREHAANCSGRGLSSMPTFQPANISGEFLFIELAYNNLTVINDNAFSSITCNNDSSIYLELMDNSIAKLSDNCFNGIEYCLFQITLTLSQTAKFYGDPLQKLQKMIKWKLFKMGFVKNIAQKIFRQKEKLLVISSFFFCFNVFTSLFYKGRQNQVLFGKGLSNNQLTSLPHALRSLTGLRHLVLDGNPLTTLDSYTMSVIGRNLWTLDISLSHFTSWPMELHFLRQLEMLLLHSIPFTSLPHNAFQGFEDTLTWLSIFDSNLIELPVSICDLSKLYRLEFVDNQHLIGNSLYADACVNLMQINDTTFLNNSLVRFPVLPGNGTFYPRLDLSYNNIRVIQDTSIHGHRIKQLILDHNRLFRIPYALNYIQDLEHLDLRNNNILSIEDPDLEKLTNLTQLQLDFNQILFISNRAFVSNIKLLYLYLTNNNLKTIPPAFLSLKNIFWIHLDHNDIDCTCSDLDFGTLNASQTIRIEGNCKYGTETLKSFIASNPPTCN